MNDHCHCNHYIDNISGCCRAFTPCIGGWIPPTAPNHHRDHKAATFYVVLTPFGYSGQSQDLTWNMDCNSPIHSVMLYTQQVTETNLELSIILLIHQKFPYSLISSSKPSAFCSPEMGATSQDVYSQQRAEIAQLNWPWSYRKHIWLLSFRVWHIPGYRLVLHHNAFGTTSFHRRGVEL